MEIWENRQIEDLDGEYWLPIKDYEGLYEISNKGRVKSLKRDTKTKIVHEALILKQKKGGGGYIQVKLSKESKTWMPIVSRLVAEIFKKEEKPLYPCIANHIDHIRHHNWVENINWLTQSQNIRDSYNSGNRTQKGESNNMAKITMEIAISVREFYKENNHMSYKEIATHFNLKDSMIKSIINNKRFEEVKEWIPSGSLTLDIATGGKGIPRNGKTTCILGKESSSKTTLALHIIAEDQKLGNTCAFLDVEGTLDLEYAEDLGVDLEKLHLVDRESLLKALGVKDRDIISGEEWLELLCKML